jgi:hypothetical protein
MPASAADDLSGSRPAVLVLRLMLDQRACLRHGELLDAEGTGQGRFVDVTELTALVRRWLEGQQPDGLSDPDGVV